MLFQRFEEKGLSHYSYAVGCEKKGQIAIIDPRRDVEIYLEYAEQNQCVISHVFETHIHGDYASGAKELAERSRASLFLSAYDKDETYEVSFPHKECRDGDMFRLGSILLKVLHTPGHTPEHISLLLFAQDGPQALFSGDLLSATTIGWTDLLGKKAAITLASQLFQTIREKLKGLPDSTLIFPAHGLGAFCEARLEDEPSSTLGAERCLNPLLKAKLTEEEFINQVLKRDLKWPAYFSRMKAYNSRDMRGGIPMLNAIDNVSFQKHLDLGATIIDLRDQRAFAAGHIPESICIGASVKVGFWASWVTSYDQPVLLVSDNPMQLGEVVKSLARVGLDHILGCLKGGFESWSRSGYPTAQMAEFTTNEIDSSTLVIDVRSYAEWEVGHLENATHIPCFELPEKLRSIPDKKVAFVCAGGYRSIFAASLAKRAGYQLVGHVPGGMHARQLIASTV